MLKIRADFPKFPHLFSTLNVKKLISEKFLTYKLFSNNRALRKKSS